MIITCPSCATRYDVDDRRFTPDGRSVRCAECDESWFVPAPQPIEDLVPLKKQDRLYAEDAPRERAEPRRTARDRNDAFEEPVEEPLFEAGASRDDARRALRGAPEEEFSEEPVKRAEAADRTPPDPSPMMRDKKGRFVKAKKEEAEAQAAADERKTRREEDRRFGRAGAAEDRDDAPASRWGAAADRPSPSDRADLRADRRARRPAVVDADFEDIDAPRSDYQDDPFAKGFGRKVRDERRRETALARMEDLEPVAERIFNEEFFAALRVQPKELERAIRKARRRAEAREKNRLTPLRAIGWSAWVGAIAACAFVGYSYRNNIVAMFPNAKTAYDAVGIEANPYGLKIEGVTHRVAMSPQGPVIEILGRLRNEDKADVAPPMLQAEALDAQGSVLSRWTFAARAEKVRAGEFADFSTRAPAPEGVSEVLLSFAPAEGVKLSVDQLLKPQN